MSVQLRRLPVRPQLVFPRHALAMQALGTPGGRRVAPASHPRAQRASCRRALAARAPVLVALALVVALGGAGAAATIVENTAVLHYRDFYGVEQPAVWSNATRVVVNTDAGAVQVAPASGSGNGGPGETVYYSVAVANTGTAAEAVSLAVSSASSPAWYVAVYADDGAGGGIADDGVHQPGENTPVYNTGSIAPGEAFNCFVAERIPLDAQQGEGDIATFTATCQSDPPQRAQATFTTTVAAAPLKGQVTDRNTAARLIGAVVNVYQNGEWVDSTLTQPPYAVYEFGSELLPGTYVVSASYPGHAWQAKWNVVVNEGSTTYLNFFLDLSGTLTGQVTDAVTGAPLVGVVIDVFRDAVLRASTVTQAPDGTYELSQDVASGECRVLATAPGYVREQQIGMNATPGATIFVDFALQRSARLAGHVYDEVTGAPVAGATVRAYRDGVAWAASTTGISGIYDIDRDLPSGTYVVEVIARGHVVQQVADLALIAEKTTILDFLLQSQ